MGKTKVYCIIVTYNAMKWIDKCLGSLRESSIPLHPVVIDNSSKDETVQYLIKNYPEVHIIINNINRGFGQANNQGIEYAYKQGATHFFLLNQDAWINSNTINSLIDVQEKYNISITSPIHLNGIGDLLDKNYFSYIVLNESNVEFVSDLILCNHKSFYKVARINAAAWLLSKKTIEEIGGFDPIFFHYGEDNNYCQRVKYHSGEIAFVPESYIFHDRAIKGNVEVYNKNATIAMLLTLYGDVNCNLFLIDRKRFKYHLSNLYIAIGLLFKLRIKEFFYILNAYYVFVKNYPRILISVRENRIKKPNWLDLK